MVKRSLFVALLIGMVSFIGSAFAADIVDKDHIPIVIDANEIVSEGLYTDTQCYAHTHKYGERCSELHPVFVSFAVSGETAGNDTIANEKLPINADFNWRQERPG